MKIPEHYDTKSAPIGLAIFGLAAFGKEYQPFIIGLEARKQLSQIRTFRVRHGNGEANSTLGQKYQDEMIYYTPTNPQSIPQQANRTKFTDAMADAMALTEEQRAPYKAQARKEGRVTWFNIFIRDYMLS